MVITAISSQSLFAQIKVACIGNSITEGFGLQSPSTQSYPVVLQTLLGNAYKVQNDGVTAKTLLKNGDQPYWTQGDLPQVFSFKPNIVTLMLGTNDTKPQNWDAYNSEFEGDYSAMIDTLSAISSSPRIFLVLPTPIWSNTMGIRDSAMQKIIIIIKQIGLQGGLTVIDCNTPFLQSQAHFPDGVHPDSVGADSIAHIMYRSIIRPQIKFACIGNSITFGYGLQDASTQAYPAVLQTLLGNSYQVQNDGVNGKDMLKNGNQPYWTQGDLPQVFAFEPNIVTIELGTNDTYPPNWNAYNSEFEGDYLAMIDTLSSMSTKPTIYPMLPPPIWPNNTMTLYDSSLQKIVVMIKQAALERGLTVIDCNTPFLQLPTDFDADGVHPNAAGADTMAHVIYRTITNPPTAVRFQPAVTSRESLCGSLIPIVATNRALSTVFTHLAQGQYELRVFDIRGRLLGVMYGQTSQITTNSQTRLLSASGIRYVSIKKLQ